MRQFVLFVVACSSAQSATPPSAPATQRAAAKPSRHAPDIARTAQPIGDARVTDRIVAARVVASIDGGIATDRPVYARRDQKVELHALVQTHAGWFGDVDTAKLDGKTIHAAPFAHAPQLELAWQRVEPAAADYSNTSGGTFHFETIDYRTTAMDAHAGSIAADVRPTLTPDHGAGVGTMRFMIEVTQGGTTIASPGPEARRGRGSGGLTDAVMRVSLRRDDTYLGFLTEMYGQPYIWASAGVSDANHQSEHLEGSDCADFIIYGARRSGRALAYTWTGGLPQVTKLLAAGTRGDDGVYRDAKGEPLPFTKPGDLILFPRHVGALVEDRGTIGVLDDHDIMMHTLFDSPKEQPIADSGYADKPVELRRFRSGPAKGSD